MQKLIQTADIDGVFVSSDEVYGNPVTGEWHHMHAIPAPSIIWRSSKPNAHQQAAALVEDFKVLTSALEEYNDNTVKQALKLLEANALYRGEKVLGAAKWYKAVLDLRKAAGKNKVNVTWLAVASAPAGFCHIKNLQIGTLFADIAAGFDFEAITNRFQAKMAQYQRAQADPTAGNIQRGEEIINDMNAAGSLQRRYALRTDIQEFIWQPKIWTSKPKQIADGVFANVKPRAKAKPQAPQIDMPATTMTWEKFQRMILPNVKALELKVPATPERFAALVTAVNFDAPPYFAMGHG